MSYDKDLQNALLRNEEVDIELRQIESRNQRHNMEQSSKDLEVIDQKICELQKELKYWMNKKEKLLNNQVELHSEHELNTEVYGNKHVDSSRKKSINQYYQDIQETKDWIIHGLQEHEDDNGSESQNSVEINAAAKGKRTRQNDAEACKLNMDQSEESNVMKNIRYLSELEDSSERKKSLARFKENFTETEDIVDIGEYNETEYSSRHLWRMANNKKTFQFLDDDRYSDIEEEGRSRINENGKRSSKIVKHNIKIPSDKDDCIDDDMKMFKSNSGSMSDESLPDIPPDSEELSEFHQPDLDTDGHMIIPPLMQNFLDSQTGPSLTGWERQADFQMLNLLKIMPKADFAKNQWQWIASRLRNYRYTNTQVANHVSRNVACLVIWTNILLSLAESVQYKKVTVCNSEHYFFLKASWE